MLLPLLSRRKRPMPNPKGYAIDPVMGDGQMLTSVSPIIIQTDSKPSYRLHVEDEGAIDECCKGYRDEMLIGGEKLMFHSYSAPSIGPWTLENRRFNDVLYRQNLKIKPLKGY